MQPQRNASDVAIELRRQFGLPKDAPVAATVASISALTLIFLLRHSVGVRLVGVPRLAVLLITMVIFGIVPSVIMSNAIETIDELWRPMLILTLATVTSGVLHRLRRWSMRLHGEKLHSRSLGTSWMSYVIPKGNAERYADPAIAIGIGAALLALEVSFAFGIVAVWLILSGLCLYAIEKYVHELQLNQYDDLLSAEAHEQVTALYLKGMSESLQQVQASAPLSTGVDAEIAASIARRARETSRTRREQGETSAEPLQTPLFADESILSSAAKAGSSTAMPSPAPHPTQFDSTTSDQPKVSSPELEDKTSNYLFCAIFLAIFVASAVLGCDYALKRKPRSGGTNHIEITRVPDVQVPMPVAQAASQPKP